MRILNVGKIVLHVLAALTLFGALGLMLAAFFTPAWQQVDIGSGRTVSHHQHGLYQVCVGDANQGSQASPLCTYMRYGKEKSTAKTGDFVNQDNDIHGGEPWRLTAMILLAITIVLAIVALTFSLLGACFLWGSIVWAIFTVLSTATAIGGITTFTLHARSEEHILVSVGTEQSEQRVGYSYYLGCGGAAAFVFASLLVPLAILALATTASYGACAKYQVACAVTITVEPSSVGIVPQQQHRAMLIPPEDICWSYPFKLENESIPISPCKQVATPAAGGRTSDRSFGHGEPDQIQVFPQQNDFSGPSQFFVFICVVSFLYALCSLAFYVIFWRKYTGHFGIPYADFAVTSLLALFWFAGSCAWATGVAALKDTTSPASIMRELAKTEPCGLNFGSGTGRVLVFNMRACMILQPMWDYAALNVSFIVGFACFVVWAGNLWFIWKETAIWKARRQQQSKGVLWSVDGPPVLFPPTPLATPNMILG